MANHPAISSSRHFSRINHPPETIHFRTILSGRGILGLNARNLLYIKPFNPKKAIALADDKLKTKAYLSARGVPVAKLYAHISSREQLKAFDFSALPSECALKPNYGFGGEGILILKGRKNGQFLEQGKHPLSDEELVLHIEDILDGKFSVNGHRDTAFFEKILVADESFWPFRPAGLPDVRIVVFNLVPVMAMLRIPTAESEGKANVHLGGIGIGIDIAKGVTTYATQYNRIVRTLPHGGSPAGFVIPLWEHLLLIASRIQYLTNVGYLAVDLTIDAEQGPVLLEINARAGLMVQVANLAPLRSRLERVEGLEVSSPEKGVRLAQDLFGERVKPKSLSTQTQPIIGVTDSVSIQGDGFVLDEPAEIKINQEKTSFSADLIDELKSRGAVEELADNSYRVKFTLHGKRIQTLVVSAPSDPVRLRVTIGRRDLKGFLIDPATAASPVHHRRSHEDARAVERLLVAADRALTILRYLRPLNLVEQRDRCFADPRYNPTFFYPPPPEELDDWRMRLSRLKPADSPLGILQAKKRDELLTVASLLSSRGNSAAFTAHSKDLYGTPDDVAVRASAFLESFTSCALPPRDENVLSAEEAARRFEEELKRYGLHEWRVVLRRSMVADCAVGGRKVFVRAAARFSEEHVRSLIAHEIETHVLTAENGSLQPNQLFRRGFAGYLATQEGLAIWNQNRVLPPDHDKRSAPARSALAVAYALRHSFADTRQYLEDELGCRSEKALGKAIDVKRGLADTAEPGAFTKGTVYVRGLSAIEEFVHGGGDLRRLYVGKVSLPDLALIESIPDMRPPVALPRFLQKAGEPD